MNAAETAWLSLLDFNHFFPPRNYPFLDTFLQQMPPFLIFTTPSTYPFPEITPLKHQNLPLLQNIYHTETIALKVTSQNLFYWLALKTIRCLAGWVPIRLLQAAPEVLVCFMDEHMYKFGSFSSRYPIATFKYYIRYGLGAKQGIFSHGALLKKSRKRWALHALSVLDGSQDGSVQQEESPSSVKSGVQPLRQSDHLGF